MIINDLDGYYIVFDTKNWNTELDTLFNNLLCNDVEGLVSSYFLYIKDLFKSLDNASFEAIASSFKHSYCQAVRQQLDQEDIFETLVQWVKKKTQCANSVARIIVSYFIQNCDVYGKLSR